MNDLPAISSPELISPLASKLVQFLAQKHAMGYRYREEGRALRELDRFLNTRLSPEDPVITLAIVHDYIARRGTESESNRAHRLTLIREVCRFLCLEDARTVVPDRRSLRIVRQKFVPRVPMYCKTLIICRLRAGAIAGTRLCSMRLDRHDT